MKKSIKYFMMAAVALLSMSACNNEMDEQQINTTKGEVVTFQMATTRTVTGTDYVTNFVKNDEVGIFAFERNADGSDGDIAVTNAKYVFNGTTWEPANLDNAAYADSKIAFNYYAYYPYQENANNPQSIQKAVELNQSTNVENYNKSDVLTAQNKEAAANSTTVNLSFKHAFALVQVNLEGDAADKDAIVTIQNIYPEAALNLANEKAAGEASGTQSAVTMYSLSEVNQAADATRFVFRAIIPAQNIPANTVLLKIQSKEKTYRFTYSEEVKYVAGASRIINVTLGTAPEKNSISFPASDMTIDTWGTTESGTGNGSVDEEVEITTKLDLTGEIKTDMVIKEFGIWSAKKLNEKEDYWFTRKDDATTIVSFDETEVAIKGQNTTLRGAWGETSFGYHCGTKTFERAKYTLTFKVKSTIVGNGVVGVGVRTSDDLKGFNISSLYKGLRNLAGINFTDAEIAANNGWKTFSMTIDTSKASSATKMPDQTEADFQPTTEDEVKGISIIFFNNLQNATSAYDTFIKDIIFEKVTE